MANTNKCAACEHYDPILRGTKDTGVGWCVKRSKYPHTDSPGQITPASAERVAEPHLPAQPHIVQGTGVKAECMLYMPRRAKLSKAELLAQATGGKR